MQTVYLHLSLYISSRGSPPLRACFFLAGSRLGVERSGPWLTALGPHPALPTLGPGGGGLTEPEG